MFTNGQESFDFAGLAVNRGALDAVLSWSVVLNLSEHSKEGVWELWVLQINIYNTSE